MSAIVRPVDREGWVDAIEALASGERTLISLWGDGGAVRMATSDLGELDLIEIACSEGWFPSVGARHAPAIRLERALADLTGLEPRGANDVRPWLDHGRWTQSHPLGELAPLRSSPQPYVFLPVEGEGLHQVPVGPVHAGIIEPGHFRFTAAGETVVRLEERFGYLHRGLESRMAGATIQEAARLASRASGDSTVAYAIAFVRAVEAALRIEPPARAHWLRALMAELERIANHFGDIGAICNDASFSLMYAHCSVLREDVLRAADAAFGHRLMMDKVIPGGVAVDLAGTGAQALTSLVRLIETRFPLLVDLYDDTASLQDRTAGTGILYPELADQFAAGGVVGRASRRTFDARKAFPYPPYDALDFEVPHREAGDVDARIWVRIEEVRQSLSLIRQLLEDLPDGKTGYDLAVGAGEGVSLVEGFRGDVFAWVRIEDGAVRQAHLRDPSWFQWPLLEAAIEGNIIADFPLINKSFNGSYAGVDL